MVIATRVAVGGSGGGGVSGSEEWFEWRGIRMSFCIWVEGGCHLDYVGDRVGIGEYDLRV
jgi:hypothetical protein